MGEKRKVRYVPVNKRVHSVAGIGKSQLIDEDRLRSIVKGIMFKYSYSDGLIPIAKWVFRGIIYDLVIKELRTNQLFYKGLNLNIIWKQVTTLLSGFRFIESEPRDKSLEEEFDELCLLKANSQDYNKKRFEELKIQLKR